MTTSTPAAVGAAKVDAVDRALRILLCFTSTDPVITLTRLSEMTGLYKSTVLRMTATLEDRGFLVRQADKSYTLGSALMRLSAVYQRSLNLESHVRPVLRRIVDKTGQTAIFYQRVGDRRRCLFKHESPKQLRVAIGEGEERPLTYSASGRILSWSQPDSPDVAMVLQHLPDLPVFALGEGDPDIASAGVPVLMNKSGTVQLAGALCIVGLRSHYTAAAMPAMRKALLPAGLALSEALGMSGELPGWPAA